MDDLLVLSGTSNPRLARRIAEHLGLPPDTCRVERFPDGEISVTLEESVRERDVFIVQPTSPPVNDNLLELVALADACRRSSARRVTAVLPYFGYARADRRKGRRVPIMGRAVADLIEVAGIDHLVTVDLHSQQVEGFFHIPVESLTAIPTLAEELRPALTPDTVVVAPDLGAVERATSLGERLGCNVAVLTKRRISGEAVEVRQIIGDVAGHSCIIVDDMITTGGTILKAAEALRRAGAQERIAAAAVHGIFTADALDHLRQAGIEDVLVTDSVASPREDAVGVRRVSVAPLLASAIRRLASGESLRDLY